MKKFVFFFIITGLFSIYSCKKSKVSTVGNIEELSNYFDAAPTGFISVNDDLRFVLKSPVDSQLLKKVSLKELISLSPEVEGEVSVINNNMLIFNPSKPLDPGTDYQVSLDLRSLSPSYDKIITYDLKTKTQDISVSNLGFYINDENKIVHYLSVHTADGADEENIKMCFSNQGEEINIKTINANEFEVAVTYLPSKYGNGQTEYNGNPVGVNKSGKLPHYQTNSGFAVVEKIHSGGSNELKLFFSKPILSKQDLTGLISINGSAPKFSLDRNILTLNYENTDESVSVNISKSIRSEDNKQLKEDFVYSFKNSPPAPEVAFLDNGVYFPTIGDFKIPIKTRNLNAIRVHVLEIKQKNVLQFLTWQTLDYPDQYNLKFLGKPVHDEVMQLNKGRADAEGYVVHGLDLTSMVKRNPGSIYHVSLDYNIENVDLACASALRKHNMESLIPDLEFYSKWEYPFRDYYYYYDEEGEYDVRNPCKIEYYQNRALNSKILICTDHGLITKKAGSNYLAAVTNLSDALPASGANVTFYSLQGEELFSGKTDNEGFAEVKNVSEDVLAVKLEAGTSVTYLKMQTYEANDLTSFDITSDRTNDGLELFTYTDRGVYRPGDSIYLDVMLNKPEFSHPDGIQASVEFYNTDNLLIDKKVQKINLTKDLIHHFVLSTPSQAKTGRYRYTVKCGSTRVSKGINIETIKPNITESIYSFANAEADKIYSDMLKGSLSVKYLTGFSVNGASVQANAVPTINHRPFKEFADYNFTGHAQVVNNSLSLFSGNTNGDGNISFSGGESFKSYQGPVNLAVQTETTLPGGGSSIEGKYLTIFPFESFIGVKKNKSSLWDDTYELNDKIELEVVNVDRKGKLLANSNSISYTVYRNTQNWWLDKYSLRTQGKYYNEGLWENIKTSSIQLQGRSKIGLTNQLKGPGLYKVILHDEKSGHYTEVNFVIYSYDYYNQKQSDVKTIRVVTDKQEYKSGEEIKLNLPKIKNSRVLVSIERGNSIIEKKWVSTGEESKEIILKTNENWLPNAYIHIMQIQPFVNDNDIPLRTYGVAYVDMIGKDKDLVIQSNVPEKLESNSTYSFSVSESTGKAMQYTLALVDEGLLNINGYKTPDPKSYFHSKYPLLVKTWDLFDKLMRYFKGNYAGVIKVGGDDTYSLDKVPEINRFKPIVIHQGVHQLKANGKNSHTIQIPNYVGKLRMMVVACNDNGAFGSLSKSLSVVNPIMVQSNHPRSLNISDKIAIPVTITRSDSKISAVNLSSKSDVSFVKGYQSSSKLNLSGDVTYHNYNVEVLPKAGKTKIDIGVKSGNKGMEESTEIAINYPNPYESKSSIYSLKPGESKTFKISPKGFVEAYQSQIQVSGFKIPKFLEYASDLIQYPYGCLEQTTSATFGQLYLDELLVLSPQLQKQRKEYLEAGVQRILSMYNGRGNFNYWQNGYYDTWADLYAGNFLIEFQRKEKSSQNNEVINAWMNKLNSSANDWTFSETKDNYYSENQYLVQAYRLFILAKAGKPAKSAMNRFINVVRSENSLVWYLLAATYQISGFESKAKEFAKMAEEKMKSNDQNNNYDYYYHGQQSKMAQIVECMSYLPDQKKNMTGVFSDLTDQMNKSWLSTYTKGYAFLATYKMYGNLKNLNQKVSFKVNNNGKNEEVMLKPGQSWDVKSSAEVKSLVVSNTGGAEIFINQFERFIDKNVVKEKSESDLNTHITYYNSSKGNTGLDNLSLGDDITVSIQVKNPSIYRYEHLALNYRVPSGFELINPRVNNESYAVKDVNYQDFRDDRVYSFFELAPGQSLTLNFKVKAAFKGDFYLPVTQCEHMYRGDIYSRSGSGRVVIR